MYAKISWWGNLQRKVALQSQERIKDEFTNIELFRCSLTKRKALPLVISIA